MNSKRKSPYRVLFVCLGNICRSPIAHGIFEAKVIKDGLNVFVDSAGTSSWHAGENPDPRAIREAREHGIDISNLRARPFVSKDFGQFDMIYVMDSENYRNVEQLARRPEDMDKIELMLNIIHPGKNYPVPDPYFGGNQGFEDVFNLLEKACNQIIKDIINEPDK